MIEPDVSFIKGITSSKGGESLKKCFQCATCSVVCSLSPDTRPFPRKEMIWAQWGLKDRLAKDVDVWLCHHCNDCSVHCPRGAKPGDVLASIRNQSFQHYAVPGFMGKWLSEPKYLPILFGIPIFFILVILLAIGTLKIPEGHVHYADFFPHLHLNVTFTSIAVLVLLCSMMGIFRFWKDLDENVDKSNGDIGLIPAAIATVKEILLHEQFNKCEASKDRYLAHMAVLYGFIALLIATAWAVVAIILHFDYPLSLLNPFKILGNIGAALLLFGTGLMIYNRVAKVEETGESNYYDIVFLGVLFTVAVTGVLTEIARLGDWGGLAYFIYFVHLVFIFFLLVYLPYSKFAHLIYRTVAIFHSKLNRRDS